MGSERQHYGAIDGLRTIAAIGIVMMHVKANNEYGITGFLYERVIPSFTHFTLLFMVISAFGMCNGYYGKIMENKIPLSLFYKKRFMKILPFFALLVLMDIAISPSAEALYEAFADVTLLFGFLPGAGNIEVIGVGWFLGVIFVFYICFPFFCCLIETRRWAWTAFAVSLIYNFVCINHFKVGSSNILYSSCYFLAGGLIYLYRNEIAAWGGKKGMYRLLMLAAVAASVILFYAIGGSRPWDGITATYLLVSATMLVYAVIVSKDAGASGGGTEIPVGEQTCPFFQRYQHGGLPFTYGGIQSDRENRAEYKVWKWVDTVWDYRSYDADRRGAVFGIGEIFLCPGWKEAGKGIGDIDENIDDK